MSPSTENPANRPFVWAYRFLRWMLGVVFIYTGATKLLDPETFAVLIDAYGLVPGPLLMPVALFLPALEVIAGAGLLVDGYGSLGTIAGLLVLFMAILGYGIWMGLDVDCGCFGPDDPEADAFHGLRPALYRDVGMLMVVLLLYGWRRYHRVEPVRWIRMIDKRPKKRETESVYG